MGSLLPPSPKRLARSWSSVQGHLPWGSIVDRGLANNDEARSLRYELEPGAWSPGAFAQLTLRAGTQCGLAYSRGVWGKVFVGRCEGVGLVGLVKLLTSLLLCTEL